MIIRQIKINRFGKLADERIEFADGLNIVYGPNESGKSTLQGFLVNMLFGMNRSRGKASKTDDFARFEPAEEPMRYAGSMTFVSGGKTYVLHRDFAAGKRKDRLVCMEDGEILSEEDGGHSLTGENGLLFFLPGISRQTYAQTQNVAQGGTTDPAYLNELLQDHYAHLAAEGETGGSLSAVIRSLTEKKKKAEALVRKQKKEDAAQVSRLQAQLEFAQEQLAWKEKQLSELSKEQGALQKELKSAREMEAEREMEAARDMEAEEGTGRIVS